MIKYIAYIFSFCIAGLRPLLGPSACRYPIGCTSFALNELRCSPIHIALYRIMHRIITCSIYSPFYYFDA
ncbi:hypothetical protein J120_01965 [candidate division TM6 bacterium JCVI TM6SC1]|uniref:Membrane protein insertion efficiency factor YidD n=1 Tax=candidate division TM6 bacterium JCVI TM6SC1 TaxID=1306947 RepID=A0A0D2I3F7_9BACT|nr:hypothetical protein J120_01965 [candidate division TM6 bacterium JCVI TM6SC1]